VNGILRCWQIYNGSNAYAREFLPAFSDALMYYYMVKVQVFASGDLFAARVRLPKVCSAAWGAVLNW
jgi:hypothetical protein